MTQSSKSFPVFALLILICIGTLSFWNEIRNDEDREWVTHTHLVIEKLQAIRIDITQTETGNRGYVLIGKNSYLELYEAGVREVHRDVKELRDLIADNPRQRDAVAFLDPLIASRLAELEDGIEIRKRSGLQAGAETVTHDDPNEKWMGKIAAQIGVMRQTEADLMSARMERAAASTRKMKIVIIFGNSLAILILLVKGFMIHQEARKRALAEQHLKLANESLERRTAELSETNIELETFAYTVAHDLRAPLRHIAGYSGVVVQDYGPHLDEEGLRCLVKITECARKMGHLVDDLLALSQIGRRELSFQDTALNSLVEQAVEDLATDVEGREVEWQISDLFNAKCDPALLKQVFTNLLSNAVKYTRTRKHAVIQVGQIRQNNERVIFIRDNGVGFDMQYVGKLFGVFQRLHKARDFEGTGVGLATVQRIIRKHGGRVWTEAELDRGATFYFTLGAPENKTHQSPKPAIHEEEMHATRS